ncbi:MAG: dCTP deaminase [Endomicrobium sp.]|jgi:dCTP deaminase|nr:dCTP deaminase [Endomicrobium sp.]
MVKNDKWIKKMAFEHKIIEPFEPGQIKEVRFGCGGRDIDNNIKKVISFGTSSYGYDMRLSDEFMVMKNIGKDAVLDPKLSSQELFEFVKTKDYIVIAPNSIVLGKSVEYFRIPRDVVTIAFGKSTYARCGIFVNITPFEPEWEGFVTLSIANTTSLSVKVYANEGIAQVLFLASQEVCEVSYADRKGKYQAQKNIISARV